MAAKVQIDFVANESDLIAAAKKSQQAMDALAAKLKSAGVSQSAYNQAMADARRKFEETSAATQKQRMSFTELSSVIQIATMAMQKLKQGYDFAKEGAQLEFSAMKFDRLAQSIGTTGDALLGKLKQATKGTMSDFEAMASATDLVSLGLVKNEKDVVRLSAVVSGLGMDMNQLVLALSNQTTMRFDQLGVAVVGFDEKVKALEKTGMSAQDAFTEAFLRQAEEQLIKVGNAADTAAGQFMKMEAEWKNFTDNLKISSAQTVVPLISTINDYVEASRQVSTQYDNLIPRERNYAIAAQMTKNAMNEKMIAEAMAMEPYPDYAQRTGTLTDAFGAQTEAVKLTDEQIKAISESNQQFLGILDNVGVAQDDYYNGLREANQALADGKITTEEHSAKVQQLASDYQQASADIVLSIVEMKLAQDGWTDAELSAYLKVGMQMGKFTQDQVNMAEGAVAMADSIVAGFDTMEGPMLHVGERAEDNADAFGEMADAGAELGESLRKEVGAGAAAATSALNSIPKQVDVNVDIWIRKHGGGFSDDFLDLNPTAPLCFVAGTLVTLADGTRKPIEQIQGGDNVRSYDTVAGKFTVGIVTHTMTRRAGGYLNIDGLLVTSEHPIWLVNRQEFVHARDIQVGDILLRDNGRERDVQFIFSVPVEADVYNLTVESDHTYFAGGVLVHNKLQQGGEVYAGVPTTINEAGKEVFVPKTDGRILGHAESLHALSMSGGMGGSRYGPFYGPVQINTGGDAEGIMGLR